MFCWSKNRENIILTNEVQCSREVVIQGLQSLVFAFDQKLCYDPAVLLTGKLQRVDLKLARFSQRFQLSDVQLLSFAGAIESDLFHFVEVRLKKEIF